MGKIKWEVKFPPTAVSTSHSVGQAVGDTKGEWPNWREGCQILLSKYPQVSCSF